MTLREPPGLKATLSKCAVVNVKGYITAIKFIDTVYLCYTNSKKHCPFTQLYIKTKTIKQSITCTHKHYIKCYA